jgi:hypothetical protein
VLGFGIEKDAHELQDCATRHANGTLSQAPIDDEENISIAKFITSVGLLNSNNILHGEQEVEK